MGCIRLVRICAMVKLYGLYYMSSLILFIFPSVPGWSSTRVFFLSELIYIYIYTRMMGMDSPIFGIHGIDEHAQNI